MTRHKTQTSLPLPQRHVQPINNKDDGDDNTTASMTMRCNGVEVELRWHGVEVERVSRGRMMRLGKDVEEKDATNATTEQSHGSAPFSFIFSYIYT